MKANILKLLAASAMSAGLLAGCSSGGGTSSELTSEPLGDVVKIGLNFELSGAVADYGTAELKGANLAIDQFNAREDKPFTVEGVEIDDKGEPSESITAATKLIEQDGVVGIVGPATSASSIATYSLSETSGVPVISPSATQIDAMMKDESTPYEYAWRVCFEDSYQGKAMAIFAHDTLEATKAVVFNEVSDYGQGLAASFSEEFVALGGEVVDQIQYNAGDTDFSSYITRIKSKDFDVIYVAGYYGEAGKIIKQAKDDGVDVPIVGADGFDSATLIDQAGVDYSNDIYFTTAYTAIDPSDELKAFIDAYQEKYGEEPGMFAALAYDSTNLLLDSLEATGMNGPELNEAIKNVDFSGVTGAFKFDAANHTPIKSVLVVELVDGVQGNVQEVSVD